MQSSKRVLWLIWLFAGMLLPAAVAHGQSVLYVDDDAPVAGDGTSWATAYNDLQDALGAANPGDEIWVAAGIYTPDRGTGDRNATFQLIIGVAIYGGFAGGETDLGQRDAATNVTILSGDLADADDTGGDDTGGIGQRVDGGFDVCQRTGLAEEDHVRALRPGDFDCRGRR